MTAVPPDAGGAGSGDGPAPPSRLRRWTLPASCAALAVAAIAALAVVSSPAHHRPAHPRTGAPSSLADARGSGTGAPTVAAVQALLERHGADVVHRDRAEFVADLDPDPAAASYRKAQTAMFDNLADVPLAAWSYRVSAPVTGGDVLGRAAARYHAPVLIARIAFSYQLRGVDPSPTEHDDWLTFVRRGGHVRIASDADLADQGGSSWHGPWDFGPVSVYRGAACLLLAHPGDVTELAGLAAVVDAAVTAVTAVWGPDWSRRVAVFVPATAGELQAVLGGPPGTDTAAQTIGDPNNPRTGLRVVLDPDAGTRLSPIGLRIVLRHEITHVAAWSATNQNLPTWLVEGFADYVGNLDSGQPVTVAAAELRAQLRSGPVPAALPSTADFDQAGTRLPAVYEQAWLACRLIASLAASAGLVRVYHLAAATTGSPDDGVDHALRTVVHMTLGQFTARWQQYLRTELAR